MKEAIGGSYIFQIVIVFIALFSTFIVYSVNYSKAFKVKNEVLDLIEQYQGFTKSNESSNIPSLSDEQYIKMVVLKNVHMLQLETLVINMIFLMEEMIYVI